MQNQADFTFIGFPYDEKSSFRRGCALAPAKIRAQFFRRVISELTPYQIRLRDTARIQDAGDVVPIGTDVQTLGRLEKKVVEVVAHRSFPLVAGGDHSTTLPVVRGLSRFYSEINILVFDAHPDLYDEFRGDLLSHACVNARLLELDIVKKMTIVGVREFAEEERQVWLKNPDVNVIFAEPVRRRAIPLRFEGPTYISIDLDVLDPVYAPGVSDWSHQGLAPSRILEMLTLLEAPVVGMDVVEVNPKTDEHDITALVAAKFLNHVAAKIVSRERFQVE